MRSALTVERRRLQGMELTAPYFGGDTTRVVCPFCEEVLDLPREWQPVTVPPMPFSVFSLRAFHRCEPAAVQGVALANLTETLPAPA